MVDTAIPVQPSRKLQQEDAVVSGQNNEWRRQSVDEETVCFLRKLSRTSSTQSNSGVGSLSGNSQFVMRESMEISNEVGCEDNDQIENVNNVNISIPLNTPMARIQNESDKNDVASDNDSVKSDVTDVITHDSDINYSVQSPLKSKAIRTLSNTLHIPVSEQFEYEKRSQESYVDNDTT